MFTEARIKQYLITHFPNQDKIAVEGILPLFPPSHQEHFGFYLKEIVTNGEYRLVCSFDVILNSSQRISVDFFSNPFMISISYSLRELVDKVLFIQDYSNNLREKTLSSLQPIARFFSD